MFERIKKFFGLDFESQLEKERVELLISLPKPTSKIVICSKEYNPRVFNCKTIVETKDLILFLKDHFSRRSMSNIDEAFVSWLYTYEDSNKNETYLMPVFLRIVDGYEVKIVENIKATMICGTCNQAFNEMTTYQSNQQKSGNWHSGTTIWECPNGHEIYRKDYRFHISRKSN